MKSLAQVALLAFHTAPPAMQKTGLLGWVTLEVSGLFLLDGITVRRTRAGHVTLSFPAGRGRGGEQHPYIRPLDDRARRVIERQVIEAIGLSGGGDR